MNLTDVEKLVGYGESETIEFKKSTALLKRAGETLCGFLNSFGGQVIIGVTSDGKIIGQKVVDSTLRDIAHILDKFEPAAPVEIERISIKRGLEVIILRAPAAIENRPYVFDGRPYQRVGSTTSIMPQERYQSLLLDRSHAKQRWENEIATGIIVDDLDREEILRTVRLGIESGRLPESSIGSEVESILDRLQLRRDGKILNAAVVLFGVRVLQDFPQCQLRMARFKGTDKSEFLDNRQIHGHAFYLLEEAMSFLMKHLPISGRFETGRLERIDEPLFPTAALREAIINAICHRTYTHSGGAVSVAIYDDRLEIWSDGTLPFDLKLEDLKREHGSKPRNPLIAGVFYRRGLIEQWGMGTQKIVELCVKAGHPEPEFGEQAGSLWVRFVAKELVSIKQKPKQNLSTRQREILQILANETSLPLRDIRSKIANPPSDRRLREELLQLKRLGLISSKGFGRGSTWLLANDQKK